MFLPRAHGRRIAFQSGNRPYRTRYRGFQSETNKQVDVLRRCREIAILQCTDSLEKASNADGQKPEMHLPPVVAASILGELGARDSNSVRALAKNLTIRPSTFFTSDDYFGPLFGYPAARPLVAIGGREAAEGVFWRLKSKLDRRELLVCAHVLYEIDDPRLTVERLKIAKEDSRFEDPPEVREVFWDNLAQVKQWLEDPRFATDEEIRP